MSDPSGKGAAGGRQCQPTGKKPETGRVEDVAQPVPQKGGILKALRRSPLVGEDVVPPRPFEPGREVDL